ncbi:Dynein-like beta chain [Invertebrate iridovirus 25]|uniref:Dynein-like beta chain n=1 Tax=Invertebrate iridovirus 25 TaxID=1301280 RepID=W8W1H4_9VIRU|nr:Dynein-like beta chain [Invertebrate iridovirus 25]CCV02043.1 Dynein-like beta chain [Invertebrate iridovirus 25]
MFTINGKDVTLSSGDTLDSLKNKISAALGTIPSLLGYTSENLPNISNGGVYTIPDPIFSISSEGNLNTRESDGSWRDITRQINEDDVDLNFLKKLYIITKIQSTLDDFGSGINPNDALAFALIDLQNQPELMNSDENENVWSKRSDIIKEFQNLVEQTIKNSKKQEQISGSWDTINPQFQTTSFVMNKINHQTEIPNTSSQNEVMVFDRLRLGGVVIACFYQDMIKFEGTHSNLIDEYLLLRDDNYSKKVKASDVIRVMITFNQPNSRVKYKFINIFVKKESITLTIETLVNETYSSGQSSIELKKLIQKIIGDITDDQSGRDRVTEKDFYYGGYSASINIPLVILKDIMTNDSIVTNLGYINESALINTRKTNLNIFLKGGQRSSDIGISLFERPETSGTLIRIKKIRGGPDFKTRVDSVVKTVNKILAYTHSKVDSILKFYQQYIALNLSIVPFEKQVGGKENILKLEAPDIFLPNYTRLCNKPPYIIDNPGDNYVSNDTILKFPIYGESEPKYYSCNYPDYKYPGLRENTKLGNKDIYPFVPCCYQRPQKKSKNYKMYYSQERYNQRINAGEIGKSLKILSPERLGSLPPKVDKLLMYTTNIKFYRYGIPPSRLSILTLLNKVTNNQNSEESILSQLVKRAELCKGEFDSLTVKEIAEKMMDPNTYISPRYFKGALEDYYQISYILFSLDQDDFSMYPNKFVRFICPLKKRVVLVIEHQDKEHSELIVDEETSTYVNKQGKKPIFTFENGDAQIKKIFKLYKERFNYTTFDIVNKKFTTPFGSSGSNTFREYPWEWISSNGKVLKEVDPVSQYVDSYGQTRLVEFKNENNRFVGQFQPLPCLKLPIKEINYFIKINDELEPQTISNLHQQYKWLVVYRTKLTIDPSYISPLTIYAEKKRLAEYLLHSACYLYSVYTLQTGKSVDEWIESSTQVVENYTYSRVTIRPIFNLDELLVRGKFVCNTVEFQNRIRFNLSLISSVNLRLYSEGVYHAFYTNVSNFKLVHPEQLAFSTKDYFQRTRKPYILNILTTENVQYLQMNTLYYIKNLFGALSNILCLFLPNLEKLVETANQFNSFGYVGPKRIVLDETKINVTVFNQHSVKQYSIGTSLPSIDAITININGNWFYGLLLPELM